MRFSPRFLKVFLRLPAAPSFFSGLSGVALSAASAFAITLQSAINQQSTIEHRQLLNRLLLGNRALARSLACAGVGLRALPPDRKRTPMAHPAVAADFHQALDVHRDLLAEIAFDATLLLNHP